MSELTLTPTWTASDGSTFESEPEARVYQGLLNKIQTFLNASDIPLSRHKLMSERIVEWEAFVQLGHAAANLPYVHPGNGEEGGRLA